MKTIYKANDEKTFNTEKECIEYEKQVEEELKKEREYKTNFNKDYDNMIQVIKDFNKKYYTSYSIINNFDRWFWRF